MKSTIQSIKDILQRNMLVVYKDDIQAIANSMSMLDIEFSQLSDYGIVDRYSYLFDNDDSIENVIEIQSQGNRKVYRRFEIRSFDNSNNNRRIAEVSNYLPCYMDRKNAINYMKAYMVSKGIVLNDVQLNLVF